MRHLVRQGKEAPGARIYRGGHDDSGHRSDRLGLFYHHVDIFARSDSSRVPSPGGRAVLLVLSPTRRDARSLMPLAALYAAFAAIIVFL